MKKSELKKAKEILLKEKLRLESELSSIAEKKKKVADDFDSRFPNWGDDVDSNAAEVDAYSSRLGIEHSLEKLLRAVSAALLRVDNGSYGVCSKCKGKISAARLKAFPAAAHCMKCQANNS